MLRIEWPSGLVTTLSNVTPNQFLALEELPLGTPIIRVNGQFSSSNRFDIPATNSATLTLSTSYTNAELYYTLDGGDPAFATAYTGPVSGITNSLLVRAFAFDTASGDYQEAVPVQIIFVPLYPLIISTPGGGSVATDLGAGPFLSNTLVTLAAAASNGWTFVRWSGDASGSNPNLTLLMDRPRSVQAIFGTPLTNTIVPNNFGVILRQPDQTLYEFGQAVRLTAVATNPGKYFTQWGLAGAGLFINPLRWVVTNATQTFGRPSRPCRPTPSP
jgi:hypothetical protein